MRATICDRCKIVSTKVTAQPLMYRIYDGCTKMKHKGFVFDIGELCDSCFEELKSTIRTFIDKGK